MAEWMIWTYLIGLPLHGIAFTVERACRGKDVGWRVRATAVAICTVLWPLWWPCIVVIAVVAALSELRARARLKASATLKIGSGPPMRVKVDWGK